jgi:hypothetical protein
LRARSRALVFAHEEIASGPIPARELWKSW